MHRRGERIGPPASEGKNRAAGMDEIYDAPKGAAVGGVRRTWVQGESHVDSRELIGRRGVNGEKAIAAKCAEVVQRALAGKAHDEVGGGDVAFEADEFDAAAPKSCQGQTDLVHKGRVVAVEGRLHALNRAGVGGPDGFVESRKVGSGPEKVVTLPAAGHQIDTNVMSAGRLPWLRELPAWIDLQEQLLLSLSF